MSEAPAILLPYQQAWVSDPAPVKVCEKSRRVGLSWAEAADAALFAASTTGSDVWYVGYNREMAQEFIGDCAKWARDYDLAAGKVGEEILKDEDKSILTYRIRFKSGHKVVALSSRPSNLRGKQGRVIIDEAAFHEDLPELLKAAMALLMWGGSVRIISTHNGAENEFNQMCQDIRAGKLTHSLHRVTLADAVAQGLYKRICLATGTTWSPEAEKAWEKALRASYGDAAAEELDCVPRRGAGAFLPAALVRACMEDGVPIARWSCTDDFAQMPEDLRAAEADAFVRAEILPALEGLDKHRPCFVGEDFGRSGDLTVLAVLQEQAVGRCRTVLHVELRNTPFRQQEQVLFALCDALPRFGGVAMDARGNGQYLAEVANQRYGSRVAQVALSQTWYLEHMPPYKAALEDQALVLPLDPDVLDDHRVVRMERGIAKVPENARTTGRDGGQRHGDSAIAYVLAWFAATTGGVEVYEYTPARPKEDPFDRPVRATAGFGRQIGAW